MPKSNTYLIVFRCVLKELRHHDVHARSHCILLGWTIQLNAQDISRAFRDNYAHFRPPVREFACILSSSKNFFQSGLCHMSRMNACWKIGLTLFRACSERVELQSPLSTHTRAEPC